MKHKIILSLVAVLLTALSAQAYDFQSGDLYYNVTSDNTVEVTYQEHWSSTNYQGLTTVTIPETVTSYNGTTYSVTSIGYTAFVYCSSLTSVTIPNSVTSIGYGAFEGCSSLTSVTIPNSVTSIESSAFYRCSSLTSVTIPNSVTSIAGGAFSGCSSLTSIVVESGNTMYDSRENCNAIIESASNWLIAGCQSTTIPNSVTRIGGWAFASCSSLTSVTLPNSVTSIGYNAFIGCTSLTSVTIPNSVTSIGGSAFAYCSSLTSVTIHNSVTSIGDYAFSGCSSIADIYCYATTPPVCYDNDTFYGISKLCNIHVPAGTIPNYQVATGWRYFSNFLEISEATAISEKTAISETEQQNKSARKIIRDGQVLILGNGVTYDMMGNTL